MKRKTGQKATLLLGSGYAALKVAEDLSHSGIPVVWVTRAPHFLHMEGGIDEYQEWPADLNFQFRPLYLRVTRHPLVTPLTHARLEEIKEVKTGFKVKVTQAPLAIDYDLCTGCGKCIEVCPLSDSRHPPLSRTPAYCPSRALELDKRKAAPCRTSCPLGVNAQAYMALTAAGRFDEALAVIRETNPLPGVCGRVCHHPCEAECRRADLDQPVAIRDIKRFLADREAEGAGAPASISPAAPRQAEKIAIVGSGPAGLTAAHYLNREGFRVTVFESLPQAGGMLRAGINSFRLPRRVLDREIDIIARSGVDIKTGTAVSSVEDLLLDFDAVILCAGTHCDLRLNLPGEDLPGVVHCVEFLSRLNLEGEGRVGARVVVIGGGNSAMDAARTALRLGAETVTVYAIEKEDQLPASPREAREAREEGVVLKLGYAPVAIEGKDAVERAVFRPAHWESAPDSPPRIVYDADETVAEPADTLIVSISQRPDLQSCGLADCVELGRGGRVCVDNNMRTSQDRVFAAGDVVTGPSTVIGSMASGRRAAAKVYEFLLQRPAPFEDLTLSERGSGDYLDIGDDVLRAARQEMAQRQPKARRRDFDEVDYGLTTEQAVAEAGRCLQCGSCCECRACESVCEEIGAIDHFRLGQSLEFSAPCVIVADPIEDREEFKGNNVFRVQPPRRARDLMDVLVAGSAVAGEAMTRSARLRKTAPPRLKKPWEESGDARLGVFICECNGVMAPASVLERLRALAEKVPGVAHAELIPSCCHPKGADRIAEAARKKKLDRVIMASCVCCPLEFHCISCNDQRSRAKIHLFQDHGLDQSRFETLNLRDELHAHADDSEDQLVERGKDLLRQAMIRARYIGPLRQGYTEIGKRILVLGGTEVGKSCAMNLAAQGFSVRLVHDCRLVGQPGGAKPVTFDHVAGITHVAGAEIEEIKGQMGDFSVSVREDGRAKRWKADMICITDEKLLPLAVIEDMMGLRKLYRYNFAFFHTPQAGLYRVMPRTLDRVGQFEAGAALAAQVATAAAQAYLKDYEISPRVDPYRCRGCGRCAEICPFDAVVMRPNDHGFFTAEVLRHNCVGCGGCVGRCPVTAMDMPYFSNQLLKEMVAGVLSGDNS